MRIRFDKIRVEISSWFDPSANHGSYNPVTKEITAEPYSSIWYHEKRHAKQDEDGIFKKLNDLFSISYYLAMFALLISIPFGWDETLRLIGASWFVFTLYMVFIEADAYIHGLYDWLRFEIIERDDK